ncbi:MAG: sigma 54-interacting transcriptional regulator [Deltaproteobacteria bacterium]|nr:sigma 54-interacting transcriptional regulator [Deltaproteobacteria bacterium]
MSEQSVPPTSTLPAHRRRVAAPRVELEVTREGGNAATRKITLDGERFRIGSHSRNDIVLEDARVSRFHCFIERTEKAWRIADCGSLNGTVIGGIHVRDADIPSECSIEIGDSVVVFRQLSTSGELEVLDQASFGSLYGRSRAMQQLFAILEKVTASDANVLIEGESGTGKELVATELVRRGPRARQPLIIIDCSAISPSLIESELFGHVKGAFTGADRDRLGAFEAAHGGTVFLDEIGELPLDMQPKLLRALESREVRRVGDTSPRRVDVRVVAATNRRLDREVNQGRFREDLFYRLSVVTVRVPPLRERLDDIELLVRVFLQGLDSARGGALFTDEVIESLKRHEWPGNVRELRNYVERCVVLDSTTLAVPAIERPAQTEQAPESAIDLTFREAKERTLSSFERKYVTELLRWSNGNLSRAARKANMDRMNLYRVLQRHGLKAGTGGGD